ncbi:MAG: AMP-binding protein, partial [Deltaproteobacteria bacterium]|jgi:long-subunit acyl-CoA synthetase (AMP-forming)|nr:AMP-binding protein [Deltaproteobacteria bacterium]
VSYLPLSHIAEQMLTVHMPMAIGGTVYFERVLDNLGETLREARPAIFLGVPRVWEKIQAKIMAVGAKNRGLKKRISAWARGVGLAGGLAEQRGRSRPLLYGLADRLVYSKVRATLGLDRCKVALSSTAPISRDTLEFFLSLGIRICEIYGMSECTGPASISKPERYRTGKAGYAIPGTELRIADDGEIYIRGPHVFRGYLNDEHATAETLDADGWLQSGDIGTLDAEGFLQVTDRKKELIITAGGKNIAPAVVESALKTVPVIAQAVVIGDRRRFLSALLTLDPERVQAEARAAGISGVTDLRSAAESAAFKAHITQLVAQACAALSRAETVRKVTILPHELTEQGGELTPTLKVKRRVVHDKYAEQIEAMYA